MTKRKAVLIFAFAVLLVFLGLATSYIFNTKDTFIFLLQHSDLAKALSLQSNPAPTDAEWKTYVDEKHGFSFQYPDYMSQLNEIEVTLGDPEPSGISVVPFDVNNCSTASDYFEKEILPYYPSIQTVPISNPLLDGFIVRRSHLDNVTPGPEAYIINCPYVIRLGFNPTGINDGEDVFDEIISSFKTWQPNR